MSAQDVPVILNPKARSARAGSRVERVRALSPSIQIFETASANDARRIASELVEAGHRKIVAAGGDGTINEVVNGIVEAGLEKETTLGVLPFGTMNVFSLELGIPAGDLEACWKIICADRVREVDLWRANGHHFVQLAGVGLDAEIIEATSWEMKMAMGPLSYVLAAAKVMRKEASTVVVRPENGESVEGSVVLIGNGKRYGGPFKIFREAEINDQLLDVIVFRKHGYPEILKFLKAAVFTGYDALSGNPDIHYFQTSGLTVESETPVPVETDGDLVDTTPVSFRLVQKPLRVLV